MTSSDRIAERVRNVVVCLGLTALTFTQRAGEIVPDTKSDVAFAPGLFLERALHLWEPLGQFGQVQNQAYGYLLPMGPFFLLGQLAEVPTWAVQRAWMSLIFCVAFLGGSALAGRLGIATPAARMLAGLVFALSPRMVSLMGSISVEALPTALAPWVLVPLVTAVRTGAVRAGAARSGLAILLMGGVNAAATLAALLPAVVWLFLHGASSTGRRLILWWLAAATVALSWWVIPLILLGRFSPPFVDWVEDAGVTTGTTSLVEVLRGTSHWVSKLATANGPSWPSAYELNTNSLLVLATVVVAALGLAGLATRSMPHRGPLAAMLVVGLLAVTAGYTGEGTGPLASTVREWLDGWLAPFRNVHKFDAAVRIPLALGAGHLVTRWHRPVLRSGRLVVRGSTLTATALFVGILATSSGLLGGTLLHSPGVLDAPPHWRAAAAWLSEREGRALVYPGASSGVFVWGPSRDEPLQYLGHASWAVRDQVPLSSAGNIRWLDAVQSRLDSGRGSPGLAAALGRAGVRYLVVRNDLDWPRTGAPRPIVVHQALQRSPGLTRVATFGPPVWALKPSPDLVVDDGLQIGYPSIEVYEVAAAEPLVRTVPVENLVRVAGGPESELLLDDADLLGPGLTLLEGDPSGTGIAASRSAMTDGMRRREIDMGTTRGNASLTLQADQDGRLGRPVRDYLPFDTTGHETVTELGGVRDVTASSSMADLRTFSRRNYTQFPFAAVDGRAESAWVSDSRGAVGEWWEIRFEEPVDLSSVRVELASGPLLGAPVTAIDVMTDAGRRTVSTSGVSGPVDISLPEGATRFLRLTAARVSDGTRGNAFGLAEVQLSGVSAEQYLRMPPLARNAAPAVLMQADVGSLAGCVSGPDLICSPALTSPGVERSGLSRAFVLPAGGAFDVKGSVLPQSGAARFLRPSDGFITASASSTRVPDPAASAQSAVDGDLGTAWVSGDEPSPSLRLRWKGPRAVSGLRLVQQPDLAASVPTRVRLDLGGRLVDLDVLGGAVQFPAVRLSSIGITVTALAQRRSVSLVDGSSQPLPVGFSEVQVLGAEDRTASLGDFLQVEQACGFGPPVVVDGYSVPTTVSGTLGDIRAGRALKLTSCGEPVELGAGDHRVEVPATAEFLPHTLQLLPDDWTTARAEPAARAVDVTKWEPTRRSVRVGTGLRSVLVVAENYNEGWTAELRGLPLHPIRLDGWVQGFVVPPGRAGVVHLSFDADTTYRSALATLPIGLLLLLVGAIWLSRETTRPARLPAGRPGVVVAVTALTLVVLGGWWGVAAGSAAAMAAVGVRRLYRGPGPVHLLAGGCLFVAGVLVAARPWGSGAGSQTTGLGPQVLCLVALGLVVAAAVLPGEPPFRVPDNMPEPGGGLLDRLVGQPRRTDRQSPYERKEPPESAGEQRDIERLEDDLENNEMKTEHAITDRSEPAHRRTAEHARDGGDPLRESHR